MRRLSWLVLLPVLAALPACGSAACAYGSCGVVATASPSGPPTAPAASATNHGWTTSAAIDPATRSIRVSVTAPGPLQVEGGCVPELAVWLVNPAGEHIEGSPSPGMRCQAIQVEDIPAGGSRSFSTSMPWPSPGAYTVHGLLRTHLPIGAGARVSENIPVYSLNVP